MRTSNELRLASVLRESSSIVDDNVLRSARSIVRGRPVGAESAGDYK